MKEDSGRSGSGEPSGLRPFGAEPATQSQAEPLVPNADDVRFLGAGPDSRGGFTFTFADGAENGLIHIIAEHLYAMMGCGTPNELNCVQIEVQPRDFGQRFTLTLQREGGKTPLRLKAEAVGLLKQALEAIETGRSEPLYIMRDVIRNWLADDPASRIEARSDETPKEVRPEGREPDPEGGTPK